MWIHARHGILRLSRLGITLAVCICAGLGASVVATPSYATTAPGDVHAQTLLIDQADREAFGIKEVRWVEASGPTPAYAHPSCTTLGHGADPLGCFAEVFGTGF
jgi:hypothetical protein